jgi:hypothetical protein
MNGIGGTVQSRAAGAIVLGALAFLVVMAGGFKSVLA